jgi:hypothetical protein
MQQGMVLVLRKLNPCLMRLFIASAETCRLWQVAGSYEKYSGNGIIKIKRLATYCQKGEGK